MDPVVHFEIPADDLKRAEEFYHHVFKWKINFIPEFSYAIAHTGPTDAEHMLEKVGMINGGMMKRTSPVENPVITIQVKDIDATLAVIEKSGGDIVKKKIAVGDMGFSAYFKDSEGNLLGLWENAVKHL